MSVVVVVVDDDDDDGISKGSPKKGIQTDQKRELVYRAYKFLTRISN